MNVETLSADPVTIEPRYAVQSEVEDGASGRFVGLGPLNTNVKFDNHVLTLLGLETLMQDSLL